MAAKKTEKAAIAKKNQVLQQLRIEYTLANTIKPNSYNPNRQSDHDFELLVRSMLEDGFTQPIVVQRQSREIIDGEHRWTCAIVTHSIRKHRKEPTPDLIKDLRARRLEILEQDGADCEIPVVLTDMTAEQMRIATLRHNRARGSEDIELAAQVLKDLKNLGALDWAQDSLMLDDLEINALLNDITAPEGLASEDYSTAWVPSKFTDEEAKIIKEGNVTSVATTVKSSDGSTATTAATAAAVDAQRKREELIKQAKTEQEKEMAMRDVAKLYRLSLIFAGDEAELVQSVLGERPAEKIVALCQAAKG